MQRHCPDCGSSDAFPFIADVGQEVCAECGAVVDDFQIYNPTSAHEVAYSLGGSVDQRLPASSIQSLVGPAGRPLWSNTLEDSRRLNEYHRKPEVDARIQGTLNKLGHPGLFSAVEFLFQRARKVSWQEAPKASTFSAALDGSDQDDAGSSMPSVLKPRRVKWGQASLLLATASCYAVLRREGIHIDIETVSEAAQLPANKVRRAFRLLKLLVSDAVRHIRLANPDASVHRILSFFHFHLINSSSSVFCKGVTKFLGPLRTSAFKADANLARRFVNTPFEAIEATALDLCNLWWPKRDRFGIEPGLAAFAIVIVAIEAHLKQPAPIYEIFRYTHQALEFDPIAAKRFYQGSPSIPELTSEDVLSKTTIALHSEICLALQREATKIPWLSDMVSLTHRGHTKKGNKHVSRKVGSTKKGMTDLVRRELLVHVHDILDVWRAVEARGQHSDPKQQSHSSLSGPEPIKSSSTTPASKSDDGGSDIEDSESAADNDMDSHELTCFLAVPSKPFLHEEGKEANTADDNDGAAMSSLDASDHQGVWSRVAVRLREGGVLQSQSTDAHPIDLLSDDQVDQWLFDDNELNSLLRTDPTELALFEQAKVAAGDWPTKSDEERNAEFSRLARNIVRSLASDEEEPSSALQVDELNPRKRKKHKTSPMEAPAMPGSHTTQQSQRPRPLSTVSLREQQDESDWSD